jgi:RNA polymerase sigma-70 factor (ECF subfamily)
MDPGPTIDAVLSGDSTSFVDLVRGYDAPVRRIVRRSMHDPNAREDVIQEVWCRVYRELSRLGDVAKFEPWLGRIARNCVTDHFRDRERLARFVPLRDDAPDAGRSEWVWELVERLDAPSRDILTWRYRDHDSYAEIAARIGEPVSTVRGRLYVARNALRRSLELREDRDRRNK